MATFLSLTILLAVVSAIDVKHDTDKDKKTLGMAEGPPTGLRDEGKSGTAEDDSLVDEGDEMEEVDTLIGPGGRKKNNRGKKNRGSGGKKNRGKKNRGKKNRGSGGDEAAAPCVQEAAPLPEHAAGVRCAELEEQNARLNATNRADKVTIKRLEEENAELAAELRSSLTLNERENREHKAKVAELEDQNAKHEDFARSARGTIAVLEREKQDESAKVAELMIQAEEMRVTTEEIGANPKVEELEAQVERLKRLIQAHEITIDNLELELAEPKPGEYGYGGYGNRYR